MKIQYPTARRDETVVEDLHGHTITDPYRWLEDPDSDETKEFVDAQNALSEPYLKSCRYRDEIEARLTELWDYPKYGCPFRRGEKYYYFMNTGLQNQSVLYTLPTLTSPPRVFLDPNTLSEDGTTAISQYSFSEDGKIFAFALSEKGSDWSTVKFMNTDTGEYLPDVLTRVKFSSLSWSHDHLGVFYNTFPSGDSHGRDLTLNLNHKLYYHLLSADQAQDVLVWEEETPEYMIGAEVSDCGLYCIIYVNDGCKPVNKLYVAKLTGKIEGILSVQKIVDNFDAKYAYITNEGSIFTFKTNLDAPRNRLITIDVEKWEQSNWKTLIPEDGVDVLEWVSCVNYNQLVVCYMQHVKNVLYVHDLASGSRLYEVPLEIGTVSSYSGKKEQTEVFFNFTSFLTPGIIYHMDMKQEKPAPTVFREIKVEGFNPDLFTVKQVFYPSKDGVKIPMFLVHRKALPLPHAHPTLLYGYGGFNISLLPSFSITRILFLHHFSGVYALANIRGGGEYGIEWHSAGKLNKKQTCFDDFCHAAEFLVSEGYTSPAKLSVMGGSNGGLLVAACANQQPELFKAVVAQVGVMDCLRFHKFTIGHAWTSDFGDPEVEEDFKCVLKYSPLHNISPPSNHPYPSMLLLTADHDDRVVPLHSLKFIATIQEVVRDNPIQTNPLYIKVDTKAGHGAGKPTKKLILEYSDIFAFLAEELDVTWKD